MGKYPNSKIHGWWSDWHINYCNDVSYLSDVDSTLLFKDQHWVEMRNGKPAAIFDLKLGGTPDRKITPTEEDLYRWYEKSGVPVYILKFFFQKKGSSLYEKDPIDGRKPTNNFYVRINRWKTKHSKKLDADQLIEWIENLK